MIDDSALFHARAYDPVKAREYYLRTRKLKGRRKTTATKTSPGRGGRRPSNVPAVRSGGAPNRSKTKSRRAQLQEQKENLEARLDRLREVLEERVEAAKGRSGVKKKDNGKDKAPETQADKADRNKDEKSKKLTPKQKADKAKKAKEDYEKENPTSLSEDIDILNEQIKDIHAKIAAATARAQERRNKAGSHQPRSGSQNHKPDGPRGR